MKRNLLFLHSTVLVMILMICDSSQSSAQDFTLRIANFAQTSPQTFEWDLVLQKTSTRWTDYAGGQYIFTFNPIIAGKGALTLSGAPGTSELTPAQAPVKFSITGNELRIATRPPVSSGYGSLITDKEAGTRVMHVVLRNSIPFVSGQNLRLAWKEKGSAPITTVAGYVSGKNSTLQGTLVGLDTRTPTTGSTTAKNTVLLSLTNHPNPFSGTTTIAFTLGTESAVTLRFFDAAGREVKKAIEGTWPAGASKVAFSAEGLLPGTYRYVATAGKETLTGKMTIVK